MTAVARPTIRRLSTDRRLQLAILILCILGIGDAGYLTYIHYSGAKALCTFGGGCETVQTSRWATLDGVPIAILGLIGYVSVLLSLAIRHELARAAAFGTALIGFGFSAYRTYRELFTIKAISATWARVRKLRFTNPRHPPPRCDLQRYLAGFCAGSMALNPRGSGDNPCRFRCQPRVARRRCGDVRGAV